MPKHLSVAVQYRDGEGTSASLGDPPDLILPFQSFGVVQRREHLTPEKKRMLAGLEAVVHDFQNYRLASGRRGKRLLREAQEGLTSQEETGRFSFVGICHAVGMDPDSSRKGLAAWPPGKGGGRKSEVVVNLASATDRRRREIGG